MITVFFIEEVAASAIFPFSTFDIGIPAFVK